MILFYSIGYLADSRKIGNFVFSKGVRIACAINTFVMLSCHFEDLFIMKVGYWQENIEGRVRIGDIN